MKYTRAKVMKLAKDICRLKYKTCAVCGAEGKLDCHHILGEKYAPFQFLVLLCPSHHKFGYESFHGNPIWSSEWMKDNLPQEWHLAQNFKYEKKKKWNYEKEYTKLMKEG